MLEIDGVKKVEEELSAAGKPIIQTVDSIFYKRIGPTGTIGHGYRNFLTHDDLCYFLQGVMAEKACEHILRIWVDGKEVSSVGTLWTRPDVPNNQEAVQEG